MVKGLYTAASGMINEQRRVDVLANNLANSSSAGFKAEGTTSEAFSEVLAYKIKDSSEASASKRLGPMNMGVKIGETYTDFSAGAFVDTNNVFDLAIEGNGFFNIETKDKSGEVSTLYTRSGRFTLNAAGELVNKDGDYVLDTNNKHIKLGASTNISMGTDGSIYQDGNLVATVRVTDFEDYNYLEKYGDTAYRTVEGATEREFEGRVYSSMYEASNVQTASEMVKLINFQRAYEANQKMIQAHDETIGTSVNEVGKV